MYLHLLCRVHISTLRGLTFHVWKILPLLLFPNSSPSCSFYLSVLKMMFCQFNSHYSNIFIHIYGVFRDRKEGEKCEGGQQRLSTPTSLVTEIIQCNIWIAIFMQQMRASKRDKERERSSEGFNLPLCPHLPDKISKIICSQFKFSARRQVLLHMMLRLKIQC